MADVQWLLDLKPGDEVVWESGGYGDSSITLAKVIKVLPTQVVVDHGWSEPGRVSRKDGYGPRMGGRNWGRRAHIEPATPELREKIETIRLKQWLAGLVTNHGRDHPPLETMRAMHAAYAQMTPSTLDQPTPKGTP